MKRIIRILLWILALVLINALLIAFSIWLNYGPTKEILTYTDSFDELEYWTILPFLLGLIFFFTAYKRFRFVGIGLTALCYSLTIFLIFFINKQFSSEGSYKTVNLYGARETKDAYYLNVEIYGWRCKVEVSPENCLLVDSVKVRIDNGLFGMRTITQNALIDLLISSSLEYNSLKAEEIAVLANKDLVAIANDLKGKLERKEFAAIGKNMDNLGSLMNLKSNIKLIKFCSEKLKQK